MVEKRIEILEVLATKASFGAQVSFGKVRVTEKVTEYQIRNTAWGTD